MIKKYLNVLIAVAIGCPAHAEKSPMAQAREVVKATHEVASQKALRAVEEDYNYALSDTIRAVVQKLDVSDVQKILLTENEALRKEFIRIASKSPGQIKNLEEELRKSFETYKHLIRKKFDLSFQVTEVRQNYLNSVVVARSAMSRFVNTCRAGKGLGAIQTESFVYPDIMPDYRFEIKFGPDSGVSGHYSSTGDQSEFDRNQISSAATSVASVAGPIAYGVKYGVVTTPATGTSMATVVSAAPYAFWGAVAVVAVMAIANHVEGVKMQNEITDAEMHVFSKSANDSDVARYYRSHCEKMVDKVNPVISVLNTLVRDPQKIDELMANVTDLDVVTAEYQNLMSERAMLLEEGQLLAKDPSKKAMLDDVIKRVRAMDEEISKLITPDYLASIVVSAISDRNSHMHQKIADINFESVDRAQKAAFNRLAVLIEQVTKDKFAKFLNGAPSVQAELRANELFKEALLKLNAFVLAEVQISFGRITTSEWIKKRDELLAIAKQLIRDVRGNEVVQFAQQAQALAGG